MSTGGGVSFGKGAKSFLEVNGNTMEEKDKCR